MTDKIQIGSYALKSRLLVGTGKYRDLDETGRAIEASGADMVTMAVRRTNLGQNPNDPNLLDVISPDRYTLLPNTAGCRTADDAVRTCRLARELLDGHNLVKLEVISESRTLYPDVVETLRAARTLVDPRAGATAAASNPLRGASFAPGTHAQRHRVRQSGSKHGGARRVFSRPLTPLVTKFRGSSSSAD